MLTELTALPESFSAGTTVAYRKSFADYPASAGWTLTLWLAGATVTSIEAASDGDEFVVTIAATDTASPFAPGLYKYVERVSYDGDVYEVGSGTVSIEDNLAEATDGSSQVWLERAVEALQAHLEGRLSAGLESYSIAGRAVSKIPIKEADVLLTSYEARLFRLKNPDSVSRSVLIEFTRTGFNE